MKKTNEIVDQSPDRENYPKYRELTVLETVIDLPAKSRSVGLCYVPVNLEPCIVLKGKWLDNAGFKIGQKVTVIVERNELYITHSDATIGSMDEL